MTTAFRYYCHRCGDRPPSNCSAYCTPCRRAINDARQADDAARYRDAVIVTTTGLPVYLDDRDEYFPSPAAAVEACHDNGWSIDEAFAVPCRVTGAPVPDLADYVLEAWADDRVEGQPAATLTPAARAVLTLAADYVTTEAPDVWTPLDGYRIDLTDHERPST